MFAALTGQLKVVRFFVQPGVANLQYSVIPNALFCACYRKHVDICGRLLVAGITPQSHHFQHRLAFLTQVMDWTTERLACHHRFTTVVLFGMHDCSGTVLLPMIGNLENVKAREGSA